jgi:hypothetical protein
VRVTASNSPMVAQQLLPANAVSIADGLAAVTISPFTRDLTKTERAAILAADRQRIFIRARDANTPPFSSYPTETLRWCVQHANLLCLGTLEEGNTSEEDVEALLSQFDRDDVAEHRFVVRIILDAPFDVADYPGFPRTLNSPPIIKQARRKKA